MTKGQVYNKDSFLANVAKSLGRERKVSGVTRPNWSKNPQHKVFENYSQDDLVDQLVKQCEKIHTKVKTTSLENLSDSLDAILSEWNANSLVSWDDPRNVEFQLSAYYESLKNDGLNIHIWNPDIGEENITLAEKADVGITFADVALAESGTVVLFSDQGKGRSVSLLPTNYIAIIPKSKVVARMTQATTLIHEQVENGEDIASCINFISGPSNSADIEMNLVVGVHGPVRAYYVILEDK